MEYLNSLGLLGPHLIADHCVHIKRPDIDTIAAHKVKVVHNPESNMKLASGIAPVPELLARGVTVGLGTDGCASNNNLDLFMEMDMAAKLHKVEAMNPTVMDALAVLKMATSEGAKALRFGDIIGSDPWMPVAIVPSAILNLSPILECSRLIAFRNRRSKISYRSMLV